MTPITIAFGVLGIGVVGLCLWGIGTMDKDMEGY